MSLPTRRSQREDTLAFHQVDIATIVLPQNEWILFSDTIQYLHAGMPDTLHLIFYGGRNGDSTRIGNTTWLDDISLYYRGRNSSGATGIVHLSADDAVTIYPNPASNILHIRIDDHMVGSALELYDMRGSRILQYSLDKAASSIPTTSIPEGLYLYRTVDKNGDQFGSGKIAVTK
jgi:Secretion system C-terminal sorting domain